ncbi:MAG: sigma-70 family RNA polymerase sigma factor [Oscillospiraceae bacterium]|nr:sigma-70 family RNA polymerase sigma factor [Oscillospiraceae bacterium]
MSEKTLDYISDYSLNKNTPEAIVYLGVDGNLIFLTEADFASREEFEAWKKWSDNDYKEIESPNRKYNDNKLPLYDHDCPSRSAEDVYFSREERAVKEKEQEELIVRLMRGLTRKEARRTVLYYFDDNNQEAIAEMEGATQPSIQKAIDRSLKKMSKRNCKLSVKTVNKSGRYSVLGERGDKPLPNIDNFIDSVKGTKPV